MNEPNFSGVDPLRVPEARRRVAAIEQYLKLDDPKSADTLRFAETVGLSRNQFGRLARIWRDHRDARLLVIGKRGAATRQYNVDDRAIAISNAVIAEFGGTATLARVAPEIESRCAAAGVPSPARSTINNYIRAARATAGRPVEGPPRIVIGRMWFHLPVVGMPASAMPTLLVAVMLPERIVVAHEISLDPLSPPSVSEVIDALAGMTTAESPERPLLLDPDDRRVAVDALARAGLGHTRSHNRSVQRDLSRAFAGRLGPLNAILQRGMARPATKRVITRQDEPLPAIEVHAIIDAAIKTQNAAGMVAMPTFTLRTA